MYTAELSVDQFDNVSHYNFFLNSPMLSVHESLDFIFSNTYLKMSGTVSEMFGSGRESENDTI